MVLWVGFWSVSHECICTVVPSGFFGETMMIKRQESKTMAVMRREEWLGVPQLLQRDYDADVEDVEFRDDLDTMHVADDMLLHDQLSPFEEAMIRGYRSVRY